MIRPDRLRKRIDQAHRDLLLFTFDQHSARQNMPGEAVLFARRVCQCDRPQQRRDRFAHQFIGILRMFQILAQSICVQRGIEIVAGRIIIDIPNHTGTAFLHCIAPKQVIHRCKVIGFHHHLVGRDRRRYLHGRFYIRKRIRSHHAAEQRDIQRNRADVCAGHHLLQLLALDGFDRFARRALRQLVLHCIRDGCNILRRVEYHLRSVIAIFVFFPFFVAKCAQFGQEFCQIRFLDAARAQFIHNQLRQLAGADAEMRFPNRPAEEFRGAPASFQALARNAPAQHASEHAGLGRAGIVTVQVGRRIILDHVNLIQHQTVSPFSSVGSVI